jgi:hypothetical protein
MYLTGVLSESIMKAHAPIGRWSGLSKALSGAMLNAVVKITRQERYDEGTLEDSDHLWFVHPRYCA